MEDVVHLQLDGLPEPIDAHYIHGGAQWAADITVRVALFGVLCFRPRLLRMMPWIGEPVIPTEPYRGKVVDNRGVGTLRWMPW